MLPRDELRKLFELRKCNSDTHDSVECARCPKKVADPSAGAAEAPSGALVACSSDARVPSSLHPCPVILRLRCR